jgi:hypothetical protein
MLHTSPQQGFEALVEYYGRLASTPGQRSLWDEHKHPREDDGKFAEKGAGTTASGAAPDKPADDKPDELLGKAVEVLERIPFANANGMARQLGIDDTDRAAKLLAAAKDLRDNPPPKPEPEQPAEPETPPEPEPAGPGDEPAAPPAEPEQPEETPKQSDKVAELIDRHGYTLEGRRGDTTYLRARNDGDIVRVGPDGLARFESRPAPWDALGKKVVLGETAEPEPEADDEPPADDEPADVGAVGDDDDGPADETPRERAAREHQRKLDENYAFARASAIPNAGADLTGSARHRANAWKGLAAAEADGSAEEMVTREQLLKAEPHALGSHVDKNPMLAMAMHLAIKAFPPKPGYGKRYERADAETKKKDRAQYVEAYQSLKSKAEELAAVGGSPTQAVDALATHIGGMIQQLRGQKSDSYMGRVTAADPYNSTANSLVDTVKKMRSYNARKAGNVHGAINQFRELAREAYGLEADRTPEHVEKIRQHALDIIEGDSINKTFGAGSKGGPRPERFNAAEQYVKTAERKGGKMIDTATVESGTSYMLDKIGMRGIQWGNYVSDSERVHHLTKASEAMSDLMDMVGLPESAGSMGGKLGLAIGARGHGNALAHYEPTTRVINLTRAGGVGSLAHEWGHFFDHEVMGGSGDRYAAEVLASGDTPLQKAYADLRKSFSDSGYRGRLSGVLHKYAQMGLISEKKATAYWKSGREVFARSFERWVQRKLDKADRANTYLAGIAPKSSGQGGLWPTDDEIDAMAPAFEAIFSAWRESKHPDHKPEA